MNEKAPAPYNQTHRGNLGWLGIGAFVVAFDVTQEESLTHAFQRGLENQRTRPLIIGALAVTALHLLQALPPKLDPFVQALDHYKDVKARLDCSLGQ